MANIIFNNKNYSVDDSLLSAHSVDLKHHLSTTMNGTGAVINLGGTAYNIDSAKLTAITNAFVQHLGTIAGNGHKVVVDGVEYSVDAAKVAGVMAELGGAFEGLQNGNFRVSWNTMDVMNNTSVVYDKYRFVKVSDYAPSYEEMSKSEGLFEAFDEDGKFRRMLLSNGVQTFDNNILVEYTDELYQINLMCASIIEAGEIDGLGVTFPETGLYVLDVGTLLNRNLDITIEVPYILHGTLHRDGDYEYVYQKIDDYYGQIVDGWVVTLAADADKDKVSYDKILNSIDGRDVKVLYRTFSSCFNMTDIPEIPDSVTILSDSCFSHCSSLTNVVIPNGITIIGCYAFYNCGLTSVTIPESVVYIDYNALDRVSVINYKGTTAQWNAIELAQDWAGKPMKATEVICSDGVVSLV